MAGMGCSFFKTKFFTMSLIKEFKAFALKGNVLDMAVAFVIGVAFSDVVNSVVNDIIMPIVGIFTGGVDFADKKIVLSQAKLDEAGEILKPENAITYGHLVETVVAFLIIALVLFAIVKSFMKLKRKREEAPAPPPAPSAEETLLTEIRDLLKQK